MRIISRYSKFDANFSRTDPWPLAQFADDNEPKLIWRVLGTLGFVACIVTLVVI